MADDALMTTAELAAYLKLPKRTLENWRYRSSGQAGPPFKRLGLHVRYVRADVDAWLAALGAESTDGGQRTA